MAPIILFIIFGVYSLCVCVLVHLHTDMLSKMQLELGNGGACF